MKEVVLPIDEPCSHVLLTEDVGISLIDDGSIDDVEDYEAFMQSMDLNKVPELNDSCLQHKVCNGLYARALFMPKGMIITGALHKNDYIDIFISGDVSVKSYFANGEIEEVKRINSFQFFEGKAGRKRVLVTHEDTLWVTVDPTMVKDVEDALSDISYNHYKDYLSDRKEITE